MSDWTKFLDNPDGPDGTLRGGDKVAVNNGTASAAILTSASGSATGSTTGNASVNTDKNTNTLYLVVTESATKPLATEVILGLDHLGAPAINDSKLVTAIGAQVFAITGLTASTTYYAHFVHATTPNSNVISTTSFTTTASGAINPNFFIVDNLHASASNSNPGTLASPWLTMQHAMTTVGSVPLGGGDDGAYFRSGIFTEHSTDLEIFQSIHPDNSGTLGNQITFERYPTDAIDSAIIDQEGNIDVPAGSFVIGELYTIKTAGTTDFTAIGASDNLVGRFFVATGVGTGTGIANKSVGCINICGYNYITIRNLHMRNSGGGGVNMTNGFGANIGIIVEGCYVHDHNGSRGGNIAGIMPMSSQDSIIRNNLIHDIRSQYDITNGNCSGILSYGQINTIIENNEIYNAANGVFNKNPNASSVRSMECRYNYTHDVGIGYRLTLAGGGSPPQWDNYIHHNLHVGDSNLPVFGQSSFCSADPYESSSPSTTLIIENNTVIDASLCGVSGYQGVQVRNNICTLASGQVIGANTASPSYPLNVSDFAILNYNLYAQINMTFDQYGTGINYTSLAALQAGGGVLTLSETLPEANGAVGDPLFTNAGAGDYSLQVGSPAIGTASDGGNMGFDPTNYGATRA